MNAITIAITLVSQPNAASNEPKALVLGNPSHCIAVTVDSSDCGVIIDKIIDKSTNKMKNVFLHNQNKRS